MRRILFAALAVLAVTIGSCGGSKKITKQQKSELQDTYETIKRELPEAMVTMDGDRVKIVLAEAVLFKINSAEINQEYMPSMKKMAKVFNKYPKTSILVTGYTDISGTEAFNKTLSEKRAMSAKEVLESNSVAPDRIHAWGMGIKDPVASNDTEEGRMQNRRVEFVVLYDYHPEEHK